MKVFLSFLSAFTILVSGLFLKVKPEGDVKLVRHDEEHKVDVLIDGNLFTSYQYPANIEKPFLFPVYSPDGSVITRGYPLEPRKNERVDHPHHIGIWFNYGNINGLDFWNNSSAIPASKKDSYGHIVHQKIIKAISGKKGELEVNMIWEDNNGKAILNENTRYIFSGDRNTRTTIQTLVTYAAKNEGTARSANNSIDSFRALLICQPRLSRNEERPPPAKLPTIERA